MRILSTLIFLGALLDASASSKLEGYWRFAGSENGIFPGYYNQPHRFTVVNFKRDSIEINSGIYYYIDNPNTVGAPKGRFPFVMVSKTAKFTIKSDSISFFYEALDSWIDYKLTLVDHETVWLTFKDIKIELKKNIRNPCKCNDVPDIDAVFVSVLDIDLYNVSYKMEIDSNDIIQFYDKFYAKGKVLKMRPGFYKDVLTEIACFDFSQLKKYYSSDESDENEIEIRFRFKNGAFFETTIEGLENAPTDLAPGIVSYIFAHQKYLYRDMIPLRINR